MRVKFSKMHGAGNDFVVLDCIRQSIEVTPPLAKRIADRHTGIGCDQLLLVERSPVPEADFRYRIFNADGGEVEQCGNGARCFATFVRDQGLTKKTAIRALTKAGIIVPRLEADGRVTVDMGAPVLDPERVPFVTNGLTANVSGGHALPAWPLELDGKQVSVHVLSMGNPHAIRFVEDVDVAPVETDGPLTERHPRFPARVNAGFLEVRSAHHARIRVFERGVGETLACGTGACAAAVAGILQGRLASPVTMVARGGELTIAWVGADNAVFMTGPAVTVFDGEFDTEALQ
jgi:diaminopimelate epimerase